jgi:hypothetical protein
MTTKTTKSKYNGKGDELSKELIQVQAELASAREGLGLAVAHGGDAAELSEAISRLQAREAGIRAGLDIITGEVKAASKAEKAEQVRKEVEEITVAISMGAIELLKTTRSAFDQAFEITQLSRKLPAVNKTSVKLPVAELNFAGAIVRTLDILLQAAEQAYQAAPEGSLLDRAGILPRNGKAVPTKHDLQVYEARTQLKNAEKLFSLMKQAKNERIFVERAQMDQAENNVQKCKERLAALV